MKFYLIILLTGLATAVSTAWAGNETGNGTDNIPFEADAAWFIGSKNVIKYCYELSPNFGVSREKIEQTVAQAYSIWDRYMRDKHVISPWHDPDWDGLQLTTNVRALARCDGTEDLKFYLGVSDETVEKYKKTHVRPTAFAQRTRWDEYDGWSKGLIWVGQDEPWHIDWNAPDSLLGIFLHEIGHTLGCSHIENTIMGSYMMSILSQAPESPARWRLSRIDWDLELSICELCSYNYAGWVAYNFSDPAAHRKDAAEIFQLFAGRPAIGEVRGHLSQKEDSSYVNQLVLSDDVGSVTVVIQFSPLGPDHYRDIPATSTRIRRTGTVFKRMINKRPDPNLPPGVTPGGIGSMGINEAIIDFGTSMTARKEPVGIIREHNVDNEYIVGPRSLKLIYGGKIYNLLN